MLRYLLPAACLSVLALLAGCSMEASTDLEQAVSSADPGAGATVLDAAGVSANQVCVLSPYTTAERFEGVTGVAWPQVEREDVFQQDNIELVAAIGGNEVVAWAEVARPQGSDLLGGPDRCSE